jgi:pimeloyl-ACP methyl ester carboxylesterase
MTKVTSADGTPIAYERFGDGAPLVVVGGALCDRAVTRPLAEQLALRFTVINYDRRGRGDSGDNPPYSVQREIEDLGALVAEAGGTACMYGHSSGAGLVLHAAANGLPVAGIVLHEPPFVAGSDEDRRITREYTSNLDALLAADRRGDAVELFMALVGMPPEVVGEMRTDPWWADAEAMAPTLAYDSAVMGDATTGGAIPADVAARVTAPALVLVGGASPDWMVDTGRRLAEAMPNGRHRVLEGQEHVVAPELLAPVLAEFFGRA